MYIRTAVPLIMIGRHGTAMRRDSHLLHYRVDDDNDDGGERTTKALQRKREFYSVVLADPF